MANYISIDVNPFKEYSANLRNFTAGLKLARAKLASANRIKDKSLARYKKSQAMKEINRARANLQQAVKCADAFLYGNQ